MHWLQHYWLALPFLSLLAIGVAPSRLATRFPQLFGHLTFGFACFAFVGSLVAGGLVATSGPFDTSWVRWTIPLQLCIGQHFDGLAALMAVLIGFIGLVIIRYSQTYLQGDLRQGQFFRWMSLTLGATLMMVTACNLVMLTVAWMLTSFGLHQLLTHYPDRSWAIWAARKKFLISRLGDLMLIAALILVYCHFGTTEYTDLFKLTDAIRAGTAVESGYTATIAILLVAGAMTKSAQFPFHSWLPDTMETPTPVSALMHAGVINAGGFLVIRLNPLISLSPLSLDLLALIGAFTAILGGTVMLTQTSVKRSLAYSTISQMGFMMLQCGLGAYSAALLHIVAHSAYKAHAFLSCGSVLDRAAQTAVPPTISTKLASNLGAFLTALLLASALVFGLLPAVGFKLLSKPGGLVLGLILTMALAQLVWQGLSSGRLSTSLRSLAAALLLVGAYLISYHAVDHFVIGATLRPLAAPSAMNAIVTAVVIAGFVSVFASQLFSERIARHTWARALYVHSMNGFYVDIPARRLTALCYRQAAPVQ